MPLEAREGVSKAAADQVGDLLAVEASKLGTVRVLTMRDVEGAMTIALRAQLADCDSTSCATEIAAALNTEQVVVGSLGSLGTQWVLTLSRVEVNGAAVLARVGEQLPSDDTTRLLQALATITHQLFGVPLAAAVAAPLPAKTPGPEAAPPDTSFEPMGVVDVGANLGVLATAVVPVVLTGAVVLGVLFILAPAAAGFAGIVWGASSIGLTTAGAPKPDFPSSLVAFLVFPGAGMALGTVAALAVCAALVAVPQIAASVATSMGRPELPRKKLLAASLVGLAVGGGGVVAMFAGWLVATALLGAVSIIFGDVAAAREGEWSKAGLGTGALFFTGSWLAGLAFLPGLAGVILAGVTTLVAAGPILRSGAGE